MNIELFETAESNYHVPIYFSLKLKTVKRLKCCYNHSSFRKLNSQTSVLFEERKTNGKLK